MSPKNQQWRKEEYHVVHYHISEVKVIGMIYCVHIHDALVHIMGNGLQLSFPAPCFMVLPHVAHIQKVVVEDSLKGYNICVTRTTIIRVIRISWVVKLMDDLGMITIPSLLLMHKPPIWTSCFCYVCTFFLLDCTHHCLEVFYVLIRFNRGSW